MRRAGPARGPHRSPILASQDNYSHLRRGHDGWMDHSTECCQYAPGSRLERRYKITARGIVARREPATLPVAQSPGEPGSVKRYAYPQANV